MADIAERVAALPEGDTALIRVGATLLLMVFAIKAAVLPLHFWLPASYSEAPGPVAALFAIMTKVGAYAIIRMYTLAFPADLVAVEGHFAALLMPAALLTLTVGMIGVLGAHRLERLVAFSVIGSMGTLLIAIALFTHQATIAALYYMIHSTFAAAALFLIVDIVARAQGCRQLPGRERRRRSPTTGWLRGCSSARRSRWRGCRPCRAFSASFSSWMRRAAPTSSGGSGR